jgi:hypothetical protein
LWKVFMNILMKTIFVQHSLVQFQERLIYHKKGDEVTWQRDF